MTATLLNRLRHAGSGRHAVIALTADWLNSTPVSLPDKAYVLLAASERAGVWVSEENARRWIDAGAAYICAWGPPAEDIEETFDYASFLEDCGGPLGYTLMTTDHSGDSLEDALWFAFYNATPPEDLNNSLETVVIVVDDEGLAAACERWVRLNRD